LLIVLIQLMKSPTSPTEVRRFLGMANQLGKFTPNLAEVTKPLCDLLSLKNSWGIPKPSVYHSEENSEFYSGVSSIQSRTQYYCISRCFSIWTRGVLLQRQLSGTWQPVVYASRALTPTEQKYT